MRSEQVAKGWCHEDTMIAIFVWMANKRPHDFYHCHFPKRIFWFSDDICLVALKLQFSHLSDGEKWSAIWQKIHCKADDSSSIWCIVRRLNGMESFTKDHQYLIFISFRALLHALTLHASNQWCFFSQYFCVHFPSDTAHQMYINAHTM